MWDVRILGHGRSVADHGLRMARTALRRRNLVGTAAVGNALERTPLLVKLDKGSRHMSISCQACFCLSCPFNLNCKAMPAHAVMQSCP